jgi:hypothetical protein
MCEPSTNSAAFAAESTRPTARRPGAARCWSLLVALAAGAVLLAPGSAAAQRPSGPGGHRPPELPQVAPPLQPARPPGPPAAAPATDTRDQIRNSTAQVPADPTGTRPPTLGTLPGASTPEAHRPVVAPPVSTPTEIKDPPKPGPALEPSKVPKVTRFRELVEGEGDSRALLTE